MNSQGENIWVHEVLGDDKNPGTHDKPVLTWERVKELRSPPEYDFIINLPEKKCQNI